MRLLFKLLAIVAALVLLAIGATAIAISYTSDCPPSPASATVNETMNAVTYHCYGGPEVLDYAAIERPEPVGNEVLVRVRAAAVNPLDWHYMRGSPYFMRLMSGIGAPDDPRMGVDFAGTVDAVGPDVTDYRPGDRVFGGRSGAFAEYVIVPEDRALAPIPNNVSFESAAAVPIAGVTALQALRDKGRLQAGQKVLVNGASGGVGSYAVQLARAMGAEVHGVCSTRNVDLVRSLGASRVFDYKQENYTDSGQQYDLIIDNVGNHSFGANRKVLRPEGILVLVGGGKGDWIGPLAAPLAAMLQQPFVDQQFEGILAVLTADDLKTIAGLIASGEVRSVIDRRYDLSQTREAIAYSESGRARGKIIITP